MAPSTTDVRTCNSGNENMIAYHPHDAASAVLSFPSQSSESPPWLLIEFHGHGAINLHSVKTQSVVARK